MRDRLVVIGSLNMDFVISVARLPAPGETVLGSGFQMIPGGKGANQAYAAGRLATRQKVCMAGRVGRDIFAETLKASLASAGVDVSAVLGTDEATGAAAISVDCAGQNCIVVAAGANAAFPPADVPDLAPLFAQAHSVLFQLETPLDTVAAALRFAQSHGARTILDPAPAQPLDRELLAMVDILTPNESEAAILLGREPSRLPVGAAGDVARAVRSLGCKAVVLKLGDQGCYYLGDDFEGYVPAFGIEARDSTAAGDTFNAALAVALGEGRSIPEALRFANGAAALSVTRLGAQASIPTRSETDEFIRGRERPLRTQ